MLLHQPRSPPAARDPDHPHPGSLKFFQGHAYIVGGDGSANKLFSCTDGPAIASCSSIMARGTGGAGNFHVPWDIAFYGSSTLLVSDRGGDFEVPSEAGISYCAVDASGVATSCEYIPSDLDYLNKPFGLATNGNTVFIANYYFPALGVTIADFSGTAFSNWQVNKGPSEGLTRLRRVVYADGAVYVVDNTYKAWVCSDTVRRSYLQQALMGRHARCWVPPHILDSRLAGLTACAANVPVLIICPPPSPSAAVRASRARAADTFSPPASAHLSRLPLPGHQLHSERMAG
jgi:hypothetical protein